MILPENSNYNYHSHTEFCDGRASMREMAAAAADAGMEIWGISPHSPIATKSKCNMTRKSVPLYLEEAARLQEEYEDRMKILISMEVDFLSPDFGPHLDFFQKLPLDYIIGSVHFVPNQDGIPLDCDGSFERFFKYLKDGFGGDLRYLVEKFFEQELLMIERGGFHILGHFDKIAGNASKADPTIEQQGWYLALIDDVIRMTKEKDLIIEINTKSIFDKGRFFPAENLWPKLVDSSKGEKMSSLLNRGILINSDAHYPDKVNNGRHEAFTALRKFD